MRSTHLCGAWVGLLACTHAFAPPRRPKLRLHSLRAEPEPSRLAAALKPARVITAVTSLIITIIASLTAINDTVAATFSSADAIATIAWI